MKGGATTHEILDIAGIIAVIIAIIIALYFLTHVIIGTGMNTTTTVYTSTIVKGPGGAQFTNATCGSGYDCLSQAEMSSLVGGSGGAYTAQHTSNASFEYYYATTGAGHINETALYDNVTGLYVVAYNQSEFQAEAGGLNGNQGTSTIEFVTQTSHSKWLYGKMLDDESLNVTNATLDGLTYSYEGVSLEYQGHFSNTSLFYAYKDNATVFVYSLGKLLNRTAVATAVASDVQ